MRRGTRIALFIAITGMVYIGTRVMMWGAIDYGWDPVDTAWIAGMVNGVTVTNLLYEFRFFSVRTRT